LVSEGKNVYDHPECVNISYPSFFEDLYNLQQ
jgi:5-enolpyruvylshikimate-3-phosphate synthase